MAKKIKAPSAPKGFGKKPAAIPTADVAMPTGPAMMKKGGACATNKARGGKVKKPC